MPTNSTGGFRTAEWGHVYCALEDILKRGGRREKGLAPPIAEGCETFSSCVTLSRQFALKLNIDAIEAEGETLISRRRPGLRLGDTCKTLSVTLGGAGRRHASSDSLERALGGGGSGPRDDAEGHEVELSRNVSGGCRVSETMGFTVALGAGTALGLAGRRRRRGAPGWGDSPQRSRGPG